MTVLKTPCVRAQPSSLNLIIINLGVIDGLAIVAASVCRSCHIFFPPRERQEICRNNFLTTGTDRSCGIYFDVTADWLPP